MQHIGPDKHLRQANDDAQDNLIAGRAQAHANVQEWKRRAKEAIDKDQPHTAKAIVEQIIHLNLRWDLDGYDPTR